MARVDWSAFFEDMYGYPLGKQEPEEPMYFTDEEWAMDKGVTLPDDLHDPEMPEEVAR